MNRRDFDRGVTGDRTGDKRASSDEEESDIRGREIESDAEIAERRDEMGFPGMGVGSV